MCEYCVGSYFFYHAHLFLTLCLETLEYVIGVSPLRRSRTSNNNFFDAEIQCAENEAKDIGVMLTQNTQKSEAIIQMFEQKKNSANPIKILDSTQSTLRIIFLNNS